MASSTTVLRIAADRADIIKSSRDAEAFAKFYYVSARDGVVVIETVNRHPLFRYRPIGEIRLNKLLFRAPGPTLGPQIYAAGSSMSLSRSGRQGGVDL